MPSKEFERVRDRLLWAKRIHVGKGIIGRESGTNTMRQLIEFYRSNQWQSRGSFGDLSEDQLRIVNKIFPFANRQQAGIASRNPRVQYFPRTKEAAKTARHVAALHNYDIQEQNHIQQFNSALRDHQFAPFPGIVRHGYTPKEELIDEKGKALQFFRPANPNRPWIRRVAPWDCLIDPRAESWHMDGGAQWCAFRSVMTLGQIKRNPHMIAREKLENFKGNISQAYADMMPEELRGEEDPDRNGYVEVWTVYDLEERKWMQLTLDGVDEWLRAPDEWPIPWEWLPINTFIVNPQIDSPYPIALLQDVIPLQNELNQVRTMMSIMVRQLRRILLVNEQLLTEESLTLIKDAALVEFFLTNGDAKDAIAQVQIGGFPQEMIQYVAMIQDDMRESVGLSLFARARRENVESATEAAAISQGQDILESRTQGAFDRFVKEAEATYMQGRRAILDQVGGEETVRIVGNEGAQALVEYVKVDAETLAGEYDFELTAGSTQPRDKEREAQRAASDLGLALQLPFARAEQHWRDYLEARSLDPAEYMSPEAAQASEAIRGADVLQRAGVEGGGAQSNVDPRLIELLAGGQQ